MEGSLIGRERCFQSDLEAILLCGQAQCYTVTPCHARVIGFGVPIIVDGEHIATVTGGECRRLNNLIDDIRDYAESKQYHMETQPIGDVIEEVLSFLRLDPTFKRFPIHRRFEADPLARYDRDRMKQVFINLLRNAAEAIDKDNGKIEVAITEEAGQIAVRISDNGKGIPPDQWERIFEPFYTTALTIFL